MYKCELCTCDILYVIMSCIIPVSVINLSDCLHRAKAKKALKKGKKAGKLGKKLKKKLAKQQKKASKKVNQQAKKTGKKVRRAMDKLRHLSTSMQSLKQLMTRINKQVSGLIPENRIRKYALEDPSKVSHSQMGKLKVKESKLVNGYKKVQNNGKGDDDDDDPPDINLIRMTNLIEALQNVCLTTGSNVAVLEGPCR